MLRSRMGSMGTVNWTRSIITMSLLPRLAYNEDAHRMKFMNSLQSFGNLLFAHSQREVPFVKMQLDTIHWIARTSVASRKAKSIIKLNYGDSIDWRPTDRNSMIEWPNLVLESLIHHFNLERSLKNGIFLYWKASYCFNMKSPNGFGFKELSAAHLVLL